MSDGRQGVREPDGGAAHFKAVRFRRRSKSAIYGSKRVQYVPLYNTVPVATRCRCYVGPGSVEGRPAAAGLPHDAPPEAGPPQSWPGPTVPGGWMTTFPF